MQDLPENQDPSVRYVVDEVTGEITYLDGYKETGDLKEEPAPKKRGRRAKADAPADAEESGDPGAEDDEKPAKETAATDVRELGS